MAGRSKAQAFEIAWPGIGPPTAVTGWLGRERVAFSLKPKQWLCPQWALGLYWAGSLSQSIKEFVYR